ncbi:CDP-alcohol phosphatidyltransferase family protein [Candidatus Phytoplasma solani]|uniref:CDP-diacylglycerol--glycerol-3-phosphate 3-phosphatidyltransferase n=1 Tax=Candidatus Phytoplasma solani TaxID=69896 RepID=A0A421NXB2_9MOLU|nr:CDP-alcohol phosphatidyltransferase family protein [Candidatus Phytoplasma solani]RMI88671.1 CDP-diacylglycerol--glycerol-3-phosphate 3-phosphatidyltransferase [Candidatus Phytoplasma solani]CCP88750.1 CDP-diacylglycerol--glycerol-3-phosphate 3-phosphatidyltransferase [Candidatus Phytoplasma solani]
MFRLVANLITVFRIVLIFFLLPLMCLEKNEWRFILAFQIIFLLAAITDYFDGYIARKYQQQTVFGKFFDPIADKLLVIIALFYFCLCQFKAQQPPPKTEPLPFTIDKKFLPMIVMIIVIREFLVTGIRLLTSDKGFVIAASFWGKLKTIFTFLAIFCLFFGLYLPFLSDLNSESLSIIKQTFNILNSSGNVFLLLAIILTIISGIDYFFKNYKIIVKNFSPE